ncbi:hypothetical protein BJ741DRAFT_625339 [Chytriomyces cf. hyalinus JEL632]|nr:hypothetical protein BJ741DRAFT_625339 [Chytriomyces cf. hyalinus JEL632]
MLMLDGMHPNYLKIETPTIETHKQLNQGNIQNTHTLLHTQTPRLELKIIAKMTTQIASFPHMNAHTSTYPISPKKRKGTPYRSPKATTTSSNNSCCDSDFTAAVFIKFPFIPYTHNNLHKQSNKTSMRVNLIPSNSANSTTFPEPTSTCTDSSSNPISQHDDDDDDDDDGPKISIRANVRFVGDSFHGSNRYWWTRVTTKPSPALSTSSSSSSDYSGSPIKQRDSKDAEYDSSANARRACPETSSLEQSPQSAATRGGRGCRGRGSGRGRGRGGRGGRGGKL